MTSLNMVYPRDSFQTVPISNFTTSEPNKNVIKPASQPFHNDEIHTLSNDFRQYVLQIVTILAILHMVHQITTLLIE